MPAVRSGEAKRAMGIRRFAVLPDAVTVPLGRRVTSAEVGRRLCDTGFWGDAAVREATRCAA